METESVEGWQVPTHASFTARVSYTATQCTTCTEQANCLKQCIWSSDSRLTTVLFLCISTGRHPVHHSCTRTLHHFAKRCGSSLRMSTELVLPSAISSAMTKPVAGPFRMPQQLWPAAPCSMLAEHQQGQCKLASHMRVALAVPACVAMQHLHLVMIEIDLCGLSGFP